ncbi:AAA family ATPase [Geminicoccus roseus]|uniref:AAA family ATPase n=1 Tax=Geminicoccus roseus TaxID=404900 RepID=UPI0004261CFC|nr:AAA family ATPase [Geminicoccus roseus]
MNTDRAWFHALAAVARVYHPAPWIELYWAAVRDPQAPAFWQRDCRRCYPLDDALAWLEVLPRPLSEAEVGGLFIEIDPNAQGEREDEGDADELDQEGGEDGQDDGEEDGAEDEADPENGLDYGLDRYPPGRLKPLNLFVYSALMAELEGSAQERAGKLGRVTDGAAAHVKFLQRLGIQASFHYWSDERKGESYVGIYAFAPIEDPHTEEPNVDWDGCGQNIHYLLENPLERYAKRVASAPFTTTRLWELCGADFLPDPMGRWKSLAVPKAQLDRLAEDFYLIGEDPAAMLNMARYRGRQEVERRSWLVDGYVPFGVLTLLIGAPGTGKSTVLHELAAITAANDIEAAQRTWLGNLVTPRPEQGSVMYWSGEDALADFSGREERLTRGLGRSADYLTFMGGDRAALKRWMARFMVERNTPPAPHLLIIDSMRRYIDGNENDSSTVSEQLRDLIQFAEKTGCAVVGIHHTQKTGRPLSSLPDLKDGARGSTAFLAEPRMVLGLYRAKGLNWFGRVKANILDCPDETKGHPLVFDALSLRHFPAPEDAISSGRRKARAAADNGSTSAVEDDASRVLAAVGRLLSEGGRVTRTNKHGLWEQKPLELRGMSRKRVRALVDTLSDTGRLLVQDDGALALPSPEVPLAA